MVPLKFSLTVLLLLSSYLVAGEPPGIEIRNDLQQCITINDRGLIYTGEIPILNMSIKTLSAAGSCGCKSALSKYSVYQTLEGYESWVMSGEFTALGREELQIPIAAQKQVIGHAKNIKLIFSCAGSL